MDVSECPLNSHTAARYVGFWLFDSLQQTIFLHMENVRSFKKLLVTLFIA